MKRFRNRHFFISDVLLLPIAAYLSFVLRLEHTDLGQYWIGFLYFTLLAMLLTPLALRRTGIYSRYWRYASLNELLLLSGTVMAATLLTGVIGIGSSLLFPVLRIPYSVPFIFLFLALAVVAAPRLAVRFAARYRRRGAGGGIRKPGLIIGAGDAGVMILRELQYNPQVGMDVVGFLDDDPRKLGAIIAGVPVLGDRSDLSKLIDSYHIQQVIIAMPTAPGKIIREIVKGCEELKTQVRIIPGIYELLDGTISVSQLREVNIEDLLRREPIQTNTDAIRELIVDKRVLVTGGGGSIGSELCRQIANLRPRQLLLIGHGENSIFHIQNELQARFPKVEMVGAIADIRDRPRLQALFEQFRPEIVFHAAAHKHVPLMEANPSEAITNNVLGTRNLVELAAEYDSSHFVMVSTDKAVNPTNVMGASKRCAERIVHQAARRGGRAYVAVRFGNVLGSRGSVVPLFKQQIAMGGPITITHEEIRRYFMTIPEAVQLVLQAAALGSGGEVFVLDMGEPVRIVDLARDLIRLSGLRPDEDIEIVFTQLRPGEKLFEELFIEGETYQPTAHKKIAILQSATHDPGNRTLDQDIERLIAAALRSDDLAIRSLLKQVVPEYQPQGDTVVPSLEPKAVENYINEVAPLNALQTNGRHSQE